MKRYGCVNAERLIVNEKDYSVPLESASMFLCLPHGARLMNRKPVDFTFCLIHHLPH